MKFFIRAFFKTLRAVLGPILLLKEKLTTPKGMVRTQPEQQEVNRQCQAMALYQYTTCPFCMKVRREMAVLSLPIQRIDAQHPGADRTALQTLGGQAKVPCLKVTDKSGQSLWMYESDKIIGYLRGRFASA
jgi:glutaredoxin